MKSTVTYPAEYFIQYAPVSVNDMLNRIPGIGLALEVDQASRFRGGNDRGRVSLEFRHDIPAMRLNCGFNYFDGIDGNRPFFDVDNVIYIGSPSNLNLFIEKVGFGGLNYRFEADNVLDQENCRERRRYFGYLRNDNLKEIER